MYAHAGAMQPPPSSSSSSSWLRRRRRVSSAASSVPISPPTAAPPHETPPAQEEKEKEEAAAAAGEYRAGGHRTTAAAVRSSHSQPALQLRHTTTTNNNSNNNNNEMASQRQYATYASSSSSSSPPPHRSKHHSTIQDSDYQNHARSTADLSNWHSSRDRQSFNGSSTKRMHYMANQQLEAVVHLHHRKIRSSATTAAASGAAGAQNHRHTAAAAADIHNINKSNPSSVVATETETAVAALDRKLASMDAHMGSLASRLAPYASPAPRTPPSCSSSYTSLPWQSSPGATTAAAAAAAAATREQPFSDGAAATMDMSQDTALLYRQDRKLNRAIEHVPSTPPWITPTENNASVPEAMPASHAAAAAAAPAASQQGDGRHLPPHDGLPDYNGNAMHATQRRRRSLHEEEEDHSMAIAAARRASSAEQGAMGRQHRHNQPPAMFCELVRHTCGLHPIVCDEATQLLVAVRIMKAALIARHKDMLRRALRIWMSKGIGERQQQRQAHVRSSKLKQAALASDIQYGSSDGWGGTEDLERSPVRHSQAAQSVALRLDDLRESPTPVDRATQYFASTSRAPEGVTMTKRSAQLDSGAEFMRWNGHATMSIPTAQHRAMHEAQRGTHMSGAFQRMASFHGFKTMPSSIFRGPQAATADVPAQTRSSVRGATEQDWLHYYTLRESGAPRPATTVAPHAFSKSTGIRMADENNHRSS